MTFEERIDRLTERHEALAQSVELVARNNIDLQASMVDMQAGMVDLQASTMELRSLNKHSSEMLDGLLLATDRLVRVSEAHEGRITKLEA